MGDREVLPEDCRSCAACCYSESPRHARVTGDDYARLGEDAERFVVWIGNEAFMRLEPSAPTDAGPPPKRCAALAIDAATSAFACSIYATRPQVCRDLARGSPACLGELETKAERPRRSLALLSGAPDLRAGGVTPTS